MKRIIQAVAKKGFTLVELLVVMAVIVILAGLVLTLIPFVNKKIARSTTEGEIKAISAALESYKADNGIYPNDSTSTAGSYSTGYTDALNAQKSADPSNSAYVNAGLVLYRALTGDRNLDRTVDINDQNIDLRGSSLGTPLTAVPVQYYRIDPNMVLPSSGTGSVTTFIDAFGKSFGYSTIYQGDVASGSTTPRGYNPSYDLWSTAGTTNSTTDTTPLQKQWIINWQVQGQ